MGNPPFSAWQADHPGVALATFADAAAGAELVVNASSGAAALDVLGLAGADNLAGKVLVDIANPLDFSQGFPPTLSVKDTDSLGEQIQRAFPEAKVVKTLNTLTASLMVDPKSLGESSHDLRLRRRRGTPRRRGLACSRASATTTSSTSARSRPPAAPRCCCPSGCASWARSAPARSTSRSCADRPPRPVADGRPARGPQQDGPATKAPPPRSEWCVSGPGAASGTCCS